MDALLNASDDSKPTFLQSKEDPFEYTLSMKFNLKNVSSEANKLAELNLNSNKENMKINENLNNSLNFVELEKKLLNNKNHVNFDSFLDNKSTSKIFKSTNSEISINIDHINNDNNSNNTNNTIHTDNTNNTNNNSVLFKQNLNISHLTNDFVDKFGSFKDNIEEEVTNLDDKNEKNQYNYEVNMNSNDKNPNEKVNDNSDITNNDNNIEKENHNSKKDDNQYDLFNKSLLIDDNLMFEIEEGLKKLYNQDFTQNLLNENVNSLLNYNSKNDTLIGIEIEKNKIDYVSNDKETIMKN